ncbi:AAA family ATPase [Collimonas pratensis]|uniref:AAA family ATPase n=1 Tax=Collimonas pratensis TaxID=279113 RepID=UPI003C767E80
MTTNCHFVVSGLPGSGKSTVASAVARGLGLSLLDKDDFLESLFEKKGVGDAQWRRKLSQDADRKFIAEAMDSPGSVLVSWWRHPRSSVESGTQTDWLASLPGVIVEIYCRCGADIAARRFLERQRHPGHIDSRWSYTELLASFSEQASLGPLSAGEILEINTEREVDFDLLLALAKKSCEKTAGADKALQRD